MPGGLFVLVAYGAQDIHLTGNPTENFFKYTAKTHVHHAKEPVILTPLGSISIPDRSKVLDVKFPLKRVGDFIHGANLLLTLPEIRVDICDSPYQVRWVEYPGLAMIDELRAIVGGSEIQTMTRDRMFSIMKLDMEDEQRELYEKMIGHVPELVDPEVGPYAHITTPSTPYPDASSNDVFSLPGRVLCIPTLFWFTRAIQESLPVGFFTSHESEIVLRLAPWSRMIQVRTSPSAPWTAPPADFDIRDYVATPTGVWELNPRLECVYYFLSDHARMEMARQEIMVPVFRMRDYMENTQRTNRLQNPREGSSNDFTLIDTVAFRVRQESNPIRRLLIFARRDDFVQANYWARLGNWASTEYGRDASGYVLPFNDTIIDSLTLRLNGNLILEDLHPCYTNLYDVYETSRGTGAPGLLSYSFGPKNLDDRSTGTLNLGRIRETLITANVTDSNIAPSVYNVHLLIETVNWFRYQSGFAGLVYST